MQKQRGAARRTGTESRQAGEQLDETLDLGAGGGDRHGVIEVVGVPRYCTAFDGSGARSAVIN